MTVAQIRTIAKLVYDAELTLDKKVLLTKYVNDTYTLRFMDMNGNVLNYRVKPDGTHTYEPVGV